ncbi:MAG: glycosyltransferase [Thermoplasmataceae archaeon]
MISIVVTTKNEGKSLPLLLNSLKDQCSGHEIVIVDSESEDDTSDIVQHYSEFLPIVFRRQRSSRGGGRNIGVKLSRGEYILFLDGDVTASPDLMASYEKSISGGADVIAGKTIPVGVERFRLERVKLFAGGFEITSPSANLCYRKDVFLKLGGFDETFVTAEDIDLNFRAVSSGYRADTCSNCIVNNSTRSGTGAFLKQAFWNGYGRYQLKRKHSSHWNLVTKGKPLHDSHSLVNFLRLGFGLLGYVYSILRRGKYP